MNVIAEAVSAAGKEISNRYDFKGTNSNIELNEKEKALEEKQSDKDVMYSIMALAAFTLFAGYISGLKAGQTRKINNKNANTQN